MASHQIRDRGARSLDAQRLAGCPFGLPELSVGLQLELRRLNVPLRMMNWPHRRLVISQLPHHRRPTRLHHECLGVPPQGRPMVADVLDADVGHVGHAPPGTGRWPICIFQVNVVCCMHSWALHMLRTCARLIGSKGPCRIQGHANVLGRWLVFGLDILRSVSMAKILPALIHRIELRRPLRHLRLGTLWQAMRIVAEAR